MYFYMLDFGREHLLYGLALKFVYINTVVIERLDSIKGEKYIECKDEFEK
jgi:hypothetical protein